MRARDTHTHTHEEKEYIRNNGYVSPFRKCVYAARCQQERNFHCTVEGYARGRRRQKVYSLFPREEQRREKKKRRKKTRKKTFSLCEKMQKQKKKKTVASGAYFAVRARDFSPVRAIPRYLPMFNCTVRMCLLFRDEKLKWRVRAASGVCCVAASGTIV